MNKSSILSFFHSGNCLKNLKMFDEIFEFLKSNPTQEDVNEFLSLIIKLFNRNLSPILSENIYLFFKRSKQIISNCNLDSSFFNILIYSFELKDYIIDSYIYKILGIFSNILVSEIPIFSKILDGINSPIKDISNSAKECAKLICEKNPSFSSMIINEINYPILLEFFPFFIIDKPIVILAINSLNSNLNSEYFINILECLINFSLRIQYFPLNSLDIIINLIENNDKDDLFNIYNILSRSKSLYLSFQINKLVNLCLKFLENNYKRELQLEFLYNLNISHPFFLNFNPLNLNEAIYASQLIPIQNNIGDLVYKMIINQSNSPFNFLQAQKIIQIFILYSSYLTESIHSRLVSYFIEPFIKEFIKLNDLI